MPTYTIEGKKVRTDGMLSDADIDAIAADIRGKAPKTEAPTVAATPVQPKKSLAEMVGEGYLSASRGATDPGYRAGLGAGMADPFVAVGEMAGVVPRSYVAAREAELAKYPDAGGARMLGSAISTLPLMAVPGTQAGWSVPARIGYNALVGGASNMLAAPTSGEGSLLGQKAEQFGTGALMGGGLSTVAEGLGGIGSAWGALRNKLSPEMRANQILSQSLTPAERQAVIAANQATPNALAGQASGRAGVGSDSYHALTRVGEMTEPTRAAGSMLRAQTESNQATLDALAGGTDRTATREAREIARKALQGKTESMRAAVAAGTETPKHVPTPAPVFDAVGGELRRGVQIGDVLKGIRTDVESVPGVRSSDVVEKAVGDIKSSLSQWADDKGFINFKDLHTIRKEIGNVIEKYAKDNASWDKKLTGGVQNSIQDMIDTAIEFSGGKGWGEYLSTFSEGAQNIRKQALFDALATLHRKQSKKFAEVVAGNDPKFVTKILGEGRYDLAKELGGDFATLQQVAGDVRAQMETASRAAEGGQAAAGILNKTQEKTSIPNIISRPVTVSKEILGKLEGKINSKTLVVLQKAAQSGASMNDLLLMTPPSERSAVARALKSALGMVTPYSINALTPRSNNQNAMAE